MTTFDIIGKAADSNVTLATIGQVDTHLNGATHGIIMEDKGPTSEGVPLTDFPGANGSQESFALGNDHATIGQVDTHLNGPVLNGPQLPERNLPDVKSAIDGILGDNGQSGGTIHLPGAPGSDNPGDIPGGNGSNGVPGLDFGNQFDIGVPSGIDIGNGHDTGVFSPGGGTFDLPGDNGTGFGPGSPDNQGTQTPGESNGPSGGYQSAGSIVTELGRGAYSVGHGDVSGGLNHLGNGFDMIGQDLHQGAKDSGGGTTGEVLDKGGDLASGAGELLHEAAGFIDKAADTVATVVKDGVDAVEKGVVTAVGAVVHFFTGDDDKDADKNSTNPDHPNDHPGQGSQPVDDNGTGPVNPKANGTEQPADDSGSTGAGLHPLNHGAELPVDDSGAGSGNPLRTADESETGGLGKDVGHLGGHGGGHAGAFWDQAAQATVAAPHGATAHVSNLSALGTSAPEGTNAAASQVEHSSSMSMFEAVGSGSADSHATSAAATDAGHVAAAHFDATHFDIGAMHGAEFTHHVDVGHAASLHI